MSATDPTQPVLPETAASATPAAGLFVHRSSSADRLVGSLAEVLTVPLSDPFAFELVCVPTPGVERWLSQSLSTRLGTSSGRADGICAGVDFARLDVVRARSMREVLGLELGADPWHGDRAVWALLRVVDRSQDEAWFAPLRRTLGRQAQHRHHTARRIIRLFASYASERPQLLRAWREGAGVDPSGAPLDPFTRWQAELWRRVRDEVGAADPAERTATVTQRIAADPTASSLPERVSVLGPTRLAPDQLQWLQALSLHREVHLFLPHPSPQVWQQVQSAAQPLGPRREDQTALLPGNRLLARLGRDSRELALSVSTLDHLDRPVAEPTRPASVLGTLQQAVVDNRDTSEAGDQDQRRTPDSSIHFHACHGPDRQVEVLREVVLGLLADDPTLEPRDIVVMCPDIETFAPLVQASFGLDGSELHSHPGQRLRVRLADRSLRQSNPLLGTLSRLLELAHGRAGRAEILDLCAEPVVARRFGFTEKDLERLRTLTSSAGVRWGLDAQHRTRFSMGRFAQNTWSAGLRRMLLGVALSEDGVPHRGTVLPLDDVDSTDVDLIGRVNEFCVRLGRVVDSFDRPQTLSSWLDACRNALTACTEVAADERWQLAHAWSEFADIAENASADSDSADLTASMPASDQEPGEVLITLSDLRGLLADSFAGRPSRANFRTGALTLCTMTPMRSVPHRVVCLLGLDDGVFPRRGHLDGDDLLAADPWVGDRDPRSEDRQVLLDAVMSATESLVVIYSGADPATGESRSPSVPLVELREAISEVCSIDPWAVDPATGAAPAETRHPLQPFASKNFQAHEPFSFDPVMYASALAQSGEPKPATGLFTDIVLPPLPEFQGDQVEVSLTDLQAFFKHPAKAFLKRRAKLYLNELEDAESDEIPTGLDNLQRWQIGNRLVTATLAGTPLGDLRVPELLRGELPPESLGDHLLTGIARDVADLAERASPSLQAPVSSQWISVDLGRWQLTGLVGGLRENRWVLVSYSKLKSDHKLESWLNLLALKCAHPQVPWEAVVISKSGQWLLGPISEVEARARLSDLLSLYERGLREWLPIPPRTGEQQVRIDRSPRPKKNYQWDWEHDAAWKGFVGADISDLKKVHATEADHGPGVRVQAPSRFEVLSHRIWDPLLEAEQR